MKNSLLLFSSILIFATCSTAPNKNTSIKLPNGVVSTGDPILDEGLKEALGQISSTQGLAQWLLIDKETTDSNTFKFAVNLFIGKNELKLIFTKSTDEKQNNEVVAQSAVESKLVLPSAVLNIRDSLDNDVTAKLASQGYTQIHTVSPEKIQVWESQKLGGTGIWANSPVLNNHTEHYLIKENNTELRRIIIRIRSIGVDNEYKLNDTVEQSIKDAQVFQKK
ncbi:MAG: hypothetical protein ACRCWI_05670 [Brevinema sp.]